jgi:D-3-phosphoglycerate dehydrogenase
MNLKIVFTDYYYPDITLERSILSSLPNAQIVDCTKIRPGGLKAPADLIPIVRDADAIVCQFASIDGQVIDALDRCRVIARYAIGVDTIDVKRAIERRIIVANVPDYCIEEVSDTAVAHTLNCTRKLSLANRLISEKSFSYPQIQPLTRLKSSVVGLVGFGNIARRVAEKLRPFGCTIIAHDPFFTDMDRYPFVEFVTLEKLLEASDIVSLHVPLTPQTRHMISAKELRRMKSGVILVNTARGAVVDEEALIHALDSGKVGMCGLDVLDMSDADYSLSPLAGRSNVVITPHIGWNSVEATRELKTKAATNVLNVLRGIPPLYSVEG